MWSFVIQENDVKYKHIAKDLKQLFGFPLNVAGCTTYQINKDNKIEQIEIGPCFIDGRSSPLSLDIFQSAPENDRTTWEQWLQCLIARGIAR